MIIEEEEKMLIKMINRQNFEATNAQSKAEMLTDILKRLDACKWIPIEERLPKDNTRVLVSYGNGISVAISTFHKDTAFNCGFDYLMQGIKKDGEAVKYRPVAWMPLPEPYKG